MVRTSALPPAILMQLIACKKIVVGGFLVAERYIPLEPLNAAPGRRLIHFDENRHSGGRAIFEGS